jgi:AraC-like DNA-binding protein
MEIFDFRLHDGGEWETLAETPSELKVFALSDFHSSSARVPHGMMSFQDYIGDGFAVWRSNYLFDRTSVITARADIGVIELCIAVRNHFVSSWDGVGQPTMKAMEFNLCYAPFVQNTVKIHGGHSYETLDFHFTLDFLRPFAEAYHELDDFLEQVSLKKPTQLKVGSLLTPSMRQAISGIVKLKTRKGLFGRMMKNKVDLLLIMAFEELFKPKLSYPFKLTPALISKAEQAMAMLNASPANPPSTSELARSVGTNMRFLQQSFKARFCTTIDEYGESLRIQEILRLIKDGGFNNSAIVDATGFSDSSALFKFFKRHMQLTPGEYRENLILLSNLKKGSEDGSGDSVK